VPHPLGTEVYSTDQVAQALNLSVRHILRAIQRGELEARKTGKQYLISQDAVRTYWESLPLAAAGRAQPAPQERPALPLPQAPAPHPPSHRPKPLAPLRRRIVDLLRTQRQGLSPAEVRRRLAAEKDLGDTMKAMVRDGILVRVAPGRYVVAGGAKQGDEAGL
jgi:excisionase family DNA binding protein